MPLPCHADEAGRPTQLREATDFLKQLGSSSSNPYIMAWANESLMKLQVKPAVRPRPAAIGTRYEVRLFTQPDNSIAVPTVVNQKAMGTFVVDTGASYTVITPRMAKKLGLVITRDTPRTSMITANGVVEAPVVHINSITIGQLQVNDVEAVVQSLGPDPILGGLLGMNFFKGKNLTIRQDRLILETATTEPASDTLLSSF